MRLKKAASSTTCNHTCVKRIIILMTAYARKCATNLSVVQSRQSHCCGNDAHRNPTICYTSLHLCVQTTLHQYTKHWNMHAGVHVHVIQCFVINVILHGGRICCYGGNEYMHKLWSAYLFQLMAQPVCIECTRSTISRLVVMSNGQFRFIVSGYYWWCTLSAIPGICLVWGHAHPFILGQKCSCTTSFQVGMDCNTYRNKAELKAHKKTALHVHLLMIFRLVFLSFFSAVIP